MASERNIFDRADFLFETGLDIFGRTIFLIGQIDDQAVYRCLTGLQTLATDGRGGIRIVMNSVGGDEPGGYAIYDAIRSVKDTVTIEGYGAVQSIASLILQAADVRVLAPQCRFMIHNGNIDLAPGVDADTAVAIGREVERNNHIYHKILAQRSGKPLEEVRQLAEAETYYSAREAVAHGFADVVLPVRRRR
jgi:ATP-dependent Clp protease protease subunit